MFNRTSLRAFEETLRVHARRTAELSQRALVETAERVRDARIAEQRSRAGVAPDYTQIVDRVRDAPLNAVRPDGTIIFEWCYLREIAEVALRQLRARGPDLSGAWKKSLTVFVDDVRATTEAITAETKFIEIAPVIIYARRLELGKDRKGGPFVVNAPPHLVEETALVLRAQYRRVANVKPSFVQLQANSTNSTGWGAEYRRTLGSVTNRKAAQKQTAAMRYPCIQIWPLAS